MHPVLDLKEPLPAGAVCVGLRRAQSSRIDVAKDKLDIHVDNVRRPFTLANTSCGRSKLIERIRLLPLARIAVESSGGYERPLLHELMDAGLPVAHVNPRVVRDYARGFNQLAKTDPIDARVLSCYARERQPRVLSSDDRLRHMLADLNRCRRQLLGQIMALKNQAETALHPAAVKVLSDSAQLLEEQLTLIDRDVQAEIDGHPAMKRRQELLLEVAGIGPVTSRTLDFGELSRAVIEMPELGTIDRRRLAALAGVAPIDDQSGQSNKERTIQGGRPHVRSALYMAALAGVQHNAVLKAYYQRLTEAGKPPKVALVACMRKLLTHLNAVLSKADESPKAELESEPQPRDGGEKEQDGVGRGRGRKNLLGPDLVFPSPPTSQPDFT
jgi:transposase